MINPSTIMMAASKNLPSILTGVALAASVAAVVECGRASFEAAKVVDELRNESKEEPDTITVAKRIAPLYIRTAILLFIASGGMLWSLNESNNRLVAMATLAASKEERIQKTEEKIKELWGEKKAEQVKKEIVKDDVKNNPPKEDEFYDTGTGTTKFRDEVLGGDFIADIEYVKHAFNEVEARLASGNIVDANYLKHSLDLPETRTGNYLGWLPGDSLNVRLQQENYISDLYDVTDEEAKKQTIWCITYNEPHELFDDNSSYRGI